MNKYKLKLGVIGLALTVGLSGCAQNTARQDSGRIIGGVLGGVLGSQVGKGTGRTAAIIGATLLGAYIGGEIGKSMDETDRLRANDALEYNRDNQSANWTNPNSGITYDVTPQRTYYKEESPCREYATKAIIGGKEEVVYGTACRQEDGSWQATN
jgi:surface antigen